MKTSQVFSASGKTLWNWGGEDDRAKSCVVLLVLYSLTAQLCLRMMKILCEPEGLCCTATRFSTCPCCQRRTELRQSDGRTLQDAMLHGPAGDKLLQTVQVEVLWFSSLAAGGGEKSCWENYCTWTNPMSALFWFDSHVIPNCNSLFSLTGMSL